MTFFYIFGSGVQLDVGMFILIGVGRDLHEPLLFIYLSIYKMPGNILLCDDSRTILNIFSRGFWRISELTFLGLLQSRCRRAMGTSLIYPRNQQEI